MMRTTIRQVIKDKKYCKVIAKFTDRRVEALDVGNGIKVFLFARLF